MIKHVSETNVRNVLVAQMCREAVAHTWRGPAAAKLLSPNVLCVRGTAYDLSADEQSGKQQEFTGAWKQLWSDTLPNSTNDSYWSEPNLQGSHSFTGKKSRTFQNPCEKIFQDLFGAQECLNIKKNTFYSQHSEYSPLQKL